MDINTATNKITTLLTEQKAKQTLTVDEIRLQMNQVIEGYADSKFKILNLQNVKKRSFWDVVTSNDFWIGLAVGLFIVGLVMFF